jgi:type II secretion system protein C
MVSYKIINSLHWLIIGLIIVLWVQFFLKDNNEFNYISSQNLSTVNTIQSSTNSGSIEQYHIFGSAQQLYDIPLNQGNTSLELILNGTMSNADEKSGMAYISNLQGQQKKYRVGDKVFDLAVLKEVHKNYVVLNHNGKNEKLSLPENEIVTSFTSIKKKNTDKKQTKPAFLKHLNGSQESNWQQLMEQQKFDPNKISKIVSNISIVTDQTGNIHGLRVSNLAQGNMLKKHGLKSNDIITAINGEAVSSKNMLTIRKTLEQSPNATVTIKRNGKTQNIKINLSDI